MTEEIIGDFLKEAVCENCKSFKICGNGREGLTCKNFDKAEGISENTSGSDIEEVLNYSKKPIGRLGQGLINNTFYYGTNLKWKDKIISAIITSENKIYLGINKISWECPMCKAIITTESSPNSKENIPKKCNCGRVGGFNQIKIINPIKDDFGLDYRVEFNEDALEYSWSTESIRDYIKSNYKKKPIREIAEEIVRINKKYIDHLNEDVHYYIACWIIATYVYTLFEQFGRLYEKAERGSGKTKQSRVIKNLVCNAMWISKGTESSIFRDAEATCGTIIVDNMDKLHEEMKRAMEHLIETGWMFDAVYRLTNKDTGRTEKYRSYEGMNVNNIYGLDENTIDKTFEVLMLKSTNSNIKRTKPTNKSENWESLRNDLRYWALDNWKEVVKTYEEISASFSGREFDVVEGVLTIAKVIGDDWFKKIESLVTEKIKEEYVDLENNPAYLIFTEVWKVFVENPLLQETNVILTDLAERGLFEKFNPNISGDERNHRKMGFSKYLSKIIRSVPMFRKSGQSNGRTYITFKRKDLEQYMKLQKFIESKEDKLNEDRTLLTSTTSTTSTKSPNSTIFNRNNQIIDSKVDLVGQVDLVEEKFGVEELDKSKIEVIKV